MTKHQQSIFVPTVMLVVIALLLLVYLLPE